MLEKISPNTLPLKELYDDLVHPTAKAVGTIVSLPVRAIRAKLSPFEEWIINSENNIDKVANSVKEHLNGIDESKIISPAPYIAIPTLQAISYCMDNDELREAYSRLLATAMNSDTAHKAHPSFTEIIKQMSPLDAKVLKKMDSKPIPVCKLRFQKKSESIYAIEAFKNFPYARRFKEGFDIYSNLVMLDIYGADELQITHSVENLCRLGILLVDEQYLVHKNYSEFLLKPIFNKKKIEVQKLIDNMSTAKDNEHAIEFSTNYEFAAIPEAVYITEFGKYFIEVCIG